MGFFVRYLLCGLVIRCVTIIAYRLICVCLEQEMLLPKYKSFYAADIKILLIIAADNSTTN